jgi:hypothetical protein
VGETWRGRYLRSEEEIADLIKLVAWESLVGRPRGGRSIGHVVAARSTTWPSWHPLLPGHRLTPPIEDLTHSMVKIIS